MKISDVVTQKMVELSEKMKTLKDAELETAKTEFAELEREAKELEQKETKVETKIEVIENPMELMREANKFVLGDKISDVARDALAPKTQWGKDFAAAHTNAIAYPVELFRTIDTEAMKTQQSQPVQPTISLPLAATPYSDRVTKLSSINGFTIPRAVQTLLNPRTATISGGAYNIVPGTNKEDGGYVSIEDLTIKAKEYNAYTIIPDISNLRAPGYFDLTQQFIVAAVRAQIEADIFDGTLDTAFGIEGLVTASGSLTAGLATTGTFTWLDAVYMKWQGRTEWMTNNIFAFNKSTAMALESEIDDNKRPLFVDKVSEAMYNSVAGKPYFISEQNADVGAANAVLFFDPRQFVLAYDQDVMVVRDNSGLTLRKSNSTGLFVWTHVGGKLVQPLTLVKSTAAAR